MQRRARRSAQCEAEKGRASQKQRSEFLAARYTRPPPGRQKSECEFCPPGGIFCVWRAALSAGEAVLAPPAAVMWVFVPGAPAVFSAGVPLPCPRPAGCLMLLRLAWSALPLPACHALVRAFFLLSFAFFRLTFSSQKSFHLSLMPRRAPHFLFGKKMGEKNREGALSRPLRTPIPAPCGQSFSLPRCWPA